MLFNIDGKEYEIEINRKENMRSFIIRYRDDKYRLSCPKYASINEIQKALENIGTQKIDRLKQRQKIKIGDDFVYLFGRKHEVKYHDYDKTSLTWENNQIRIYGKNKEKILDDFLEDMLYGYVKNRIVNYMTLGYISFLPQIEIKKMKSVHGLCHTQKGLVKFSFNLVHQPPSVIDSIIIHELGHFYYPNHSKDFYNWVYSHDSNYQKSMEYLKQGGAGDDQFD